MSQREKHIVSNNLRLIIEIGGTKGHWFWIDDTGIVQEQVSAGFNPTYHTSNDWSWPDTPLAAQTTAVYYYGAGCGEAAYRAIVKQLLEKHFAQASIHIYSDLEGAVQATVGNGSGLVCILGTGSHVCQVIDGKISREAASFGPSLEDHGSGYEIGRLFLLALFNGELPEQISAAILEHFEMTTGRLKQAMIRGLSPHRIAEVAQIGSNFLDLAQARKIIYHSFEAFVSHKVWPLSKGQQLEVYAVGSIAFHLREILLQVLSNYHLPYDGSGIIASPINKLVRFHLQ